MTYRPRPPARHPRPRYDTPLVTNRPRKQRTSIVVRQVTRLVDAFAMQCSVLAFAMLACHDRLFASGTLNITGPAVNHTVHRKSSVASPPRQSGDLLAP